MDIKGFFDEYRWLSNFYPSPIRFDPNHIAPTSEHLYQAVKVKDPGTRVRILSAKTPRDAKQIANSAEFVPDWHDKKVDVMRKILVMKFHSHPELYALLKATGTGYLEETNYWGDRFWGVCKGEGENWLGKLLMSVREERGPSGWMDGVLEQGGSFGDEFDVVVIRDPATFIGVRALKCVNDQYVDYRTYLHPSRWTPEN